MTNIDFCFLQFGVNGNFQFLAVLPNSIFGIFIGHQLDQLGSNKMQYSICGTRILKFIFNNNFWEALILLMYYHWWEQFKKKINSDNPFEDQIFIFHLNKGLLKNNGKGSERRKSERWKSKSWLKIWKGSERWKSNYTFDVLIFFDAIGNIRTSKV